MKHREIWAEIAGAFYTPEGGRSSKQKHAAGTGLCNAAAEYNIGYESLRKIVPTEAYWLPVRNDYCGCNGAEPHTRKHDLIRGDFATLMACMTEKEFNQLVAGTPAQQKDGAL